MDIECRLEQLLLLDLVEIMPSGCGWRGRRQTAEKDQVFISLSPNRANKYRHAPMFAGSS